MVGNKSEGLLQACISSLKIRLRVRDFYDSNREGVIIIVLVESGIKRKILHKNIEKRELNSFFFKNYCFTTRYLSRNK